MGSLVIIRSQDFSPTFQLKATLETQIKPNYYTRASLYEVLKEELGILFTAKLWQFTYVFFHMSKTGSNTVVST